MKLPIKGKLGNKEMTISELKSFFLTLKILQVEVKDLINNSVYLLTGFGKGKGI